MDKVDMSLDEIIRLNKKEQKLDKKQGVVNRRPVKKKGRLMQGTGVRRGAGAPTQRGVGLSQRVAPKQNNRKVPVVAARRRGQAPGVVTGLASRRTGALLKRLGTINRTATGSQGKRGFLTRPKIRPFIQNTASTNQYKKSEGQPKTYRAPEPQKSLNPTTVKRPFQLRRRALPSLQTQRDARQATFLFHRGLKMSKEAKAVGQSWEGQPDHVGPGNLERSAEAVL